MKLSGRMLVYLGEGLNFVAVLLPAACLCIVQPPIPCGPDERCEMTENTAVKSRILAALAEDASHGAFDSAALLAKAATEEGASIEEIMEALGVKQFSGRVNGLHTSAKALGELQERGERSDSDGVGVGDGVGVS